MSVHARKTKTRVVYWVCTSYSSDGKKRQHWERSGTDKREAYSLNAQRKGEVKAGVFRPGRITDRASFAAFAESWLRGRKNRGAELDRVVIERNVLSVPWFATMPMGSIRPKHLHKLIAEVSAGPLAPKSVSNIFGLLRVLFRDAVIQDTLTETPYVVPRGILRRSGKKRLPYTIAEARALTSLAVPVRERTWNLVAFLTGARCGELCGLRWKDWDEGSKPLGALSIERQYDGLPLKTERPRVAPVHPELAAALGAWRATWRVLHCRAPEGDELIFPGQGGALTKSSAYKAWIRSCRVSGVTNRSVHSTRHTFISLARRAGAEKEMVELITHNPKGTIVDRYTTREWSELCAVVSLVNLGTEVDAPVDPPPPSPIDYGSSSRTRTRVSDGKQGKESDSELPGHAENPAEKGIRVVTDARVDASQLWKRRPGWFGRKGRAA